MKHRRLPLFLALFAVAVSAQAESRSNPFARGSSNTQAPPAVTSLFPRAPLVSYEHAYDEALATVEAATTDSAEPALTRNHSVSVPSSRAAKSGPSFRPLAPPAVAVATRVASPVVLEATPLPPPENLAAASSLPLPPPPVLPPPRQRLESPVMAGMADSAATSTSTVNEEKQAAPSEREVRAQRCKTVRYTGKNLAVVAGTTSVIRLPFKDLTGCLDAVSADAPWVEVVNSSGNELELLIERNPTTKQRKASVAVVTPRLVVDVRIQQNAGDPRDPLETSHAN